MWRSAYRSLRSRRHLWLLAVIGTALAVRLVHLRWMVEQPVATYQVEWADSDMSTHWIWSSRILEGDVLGLDTPHPYLRWMQEIASAETWERWRGGKRVFFKAPLYAYTLAGMRLVVGDGYFGLGFCHLLLGVLNCALIFVLANRFFGVAVAAIAGLGAAFYGPFLLYESVFLRDGLSTTVTLLLLWGLSRCTDERMRPWFGAGLLFALALLGRELTLLFGPFVALWMAQRFWGRWKVLSRVALSFAAGVSLGLVPLVARNLAVEAPPFALSAVGNEGIIYGHIADGLPAGFWPPPSAAAALRQADGRLGEALRLTLASYRGDWWRLVGHEAERLAAIFSSYEPADNVNWHYFILRSRLLCYSLRYELVLALGLVGLWLSRGRAPDIVLLYFLLSALVGLQYTAVVGRYRLVATAVLFIYAGVTVHDLGLSLVHRRWRAAAGIAAAVLTLVVVSSNLLRAGATLQRQRPAEFILAAKYYAMRKQPEHVYAELRDGLETAYAGPDQRRLPPEYRLMPEDLVRVGQGLGRSDDAAAVLSRLVRVYDQDQHLAQLLRTLEHP